MIFDTLPSGALLSEGKRYFIAPIVVGAERPLQAWAKGSPQWNWLGTFSTVELAIDACERDATKAAA